LILSLTGKQS